MTQHKKRPIDKNSDRPRARKGFGPHSHSHRPYNAPEQRVTPAVKLLLPLFELVVRGFGKDHKSALCAAFSNATDQEIASIQIRHAAGAQYKKSLSGIVTTHKAQSADDLVRNLQNLLNSYPNSPYVVARQISLEFALGHMEKAENHSRRFRELCRSQGLSQVQGQEIIRALTRG
ncbi:MAG: hypothetical protein RBR86_05050 [Pseudobdellovibrionaceae bacterium]|jgi:hypothetical protein|nr:hypothetical protein [Pseudobdellovibrionaceae bacterium]